MTAQGGFLYLDHAATTPVRDEVAAAMEEARREAFANPSSPHAAGRRARARLEGCRERILGLLGATDPGDRLVFTSGATEANRFAVLGMAAGIDAGIDAAADPAAGDATDRADGRNRGAGGIAAHSARDHASCRAAMAELAMRAGWETVCVPLSRGGTLDSDWFSGWAAARPPGPRLLSTTLVCGQTGIVESVPGGPSPLDHVRAGAAAGPGLVVHVDATQAIGLLDVAFPRPPVATLTLAPHKFGGPRGIGGLVIRAGAPFAPVVPGPQEGGLRGGTEAVTLAAGFATALELAVAERSAEARRIALLRDRFEARLADVAGGRGVELHVVGGGGLAAGREPIRRAPHITTVAFSARGSGGEPRRIDRQAFVMAADLEGVCAATGTACASGSSEPAPALVALGLPTGLVEAAVRFSFGRDTTAADADEAVDRIGRVLARMAAG